MRIEIPDLCVVALVGASGSGKSTFARQHFKPTEVLSSDYFRGLISDDETNQIVSAEAFETLYYVANRRLDQGLLTVVDATNVSKEARKEVLHLAREQDCFAVAIVFNLPEAVCQERNARRTDRSVERRVISRQSEQLRRSIRNLKKEGFRYVFVLSSEDEISQVEIVRTTLWSNRKGETGPFDIIGDVHGCYDELCELLDELGYEVDARACTARAPVGQGRKAIFLGDLCDRGPGNVQVLRLVMNMVSTGSAYCIAGNHDNKLLRHLRGAKVTTDHGLQLTIDQLAQESARLADVADGASGGAVGAAAISGGAGGGEHGVSGLAGTATGDPSQADFISEVATFLDSLVSHYVFDDGKLVVAHAGIKERYQGRSSGRVRSFCLYGDTTGEIDEYGLPVRLPWALDYRGKATVVFGHTPTPEVESVNNTFCIDTGCVFGGKLTAFRYPEKQIVQVDARREYYAPVKPLFVKDASHESILNIEDVFGDKHLSTRLRRSIRINMENSAAALEVMSRFSADPNWLIYLPPTMSPSETSSLPDYLEHPTEAFDYYRNRSVNQVVCEQKHMGSRAVIIVCKDTDTVKRRFLASSGGGSSSSSSGGGGGSSSGSGSGSLGIIYTRTGRHFFDDHHTEQAILARLQAVLADSGFWQDFDTDWVCLDAELMPWSAKAQQLLVEQYSSVGRAGRNALSSALTAIEQAVSLLPERELIPMNEARETADMTELALRYQQRLDALTLYTEAYRRYCWDVNSLDDYRIAAFHIMATEGRVWCDESHLWQMQTIARYTADRDPIFVATNHLLVDLHDPSSVDAAVQWWTELTDAGGEGMVVKPFDFIAFSGNELLQPAIKCRGREYLRIIYGPEYLLADNLKRLKRRSLARKRNLALGEFALGVESLERFVREEPLYRVHECVFAVLAMESEPIDPRL
ncbi:MAG: polynucleotide kinase-phosphatase [Coriobacteriia bacterium]|nr:polynucleotide kinase-phosphatase [Coriobacteriia bacterium]